MKNFKLGLLSIFVVSLFVFVIFACTNNETTDKSQNAVGSNNARILSKSELTNKIKAGVEIECAGSCDCYFNMNTGVGNCSCSPCHLDLHFIDKRVSITGSDKDDIYESIIDNDLFKSTIRDLQVYVKDNYQTDVKGYKSIEFYIKNDVTVIVYKFIGADNVVNSVLYSQKVAGKKFRVDCTGSCDCLEQFNFNTNTASCSCSSCSMTVTEIP